MNDDGAPEIVAVARLSKRQAQKGGEFAIVVEDCCQRIGLGTELLTRLVRVAGDEGLDWIGADLRPDNIGARRAAEKAGFTVRETPNASTFRAELRLHP